MPVMTYSIPTTSIIRFKASMSKNEKASYVYLPIILARSKKVKIPKPLLRRSSAIDVEIQQAYERYASIGKSL